MTYVGVRELKDRLTHYLRQARDVGPVIVTDRGKPIVILHDLSGVEETAGLEERLASLAHRGLVRLPARKGGLAAGKPAKNTGRAASAMIVEDRR